MPNSLLKVEAGTKHFGSQPILTNINITVKQGEFISLLGPSGCGKTTLLRLLAGLEEWTMGTTETQQQIKSSFVFQEPNLLGWRTVLENIQLPNELSKAPLSVEEQINILKSVQLEQAAKLFPHELSGGMKMRTSIARALATRPQLLFMDEPFSALDEPTREKLQEQLRTLWEKNSTTILFVTHSLAEAVFLSNRILFLDGRPATMAHDYPLSLPAQRTSETRSTKAFFEELNHLRNLFHSQHREDSRP